MPLLSVQDLHVRLGSGTVWSQLGGRSPDDVLKGLTFDLARGETLGFLGESGSGKSTLARTLMGLLRPRQGSIVFDDQHIDTDAARRRLLRHVRLLFQSPLASLSPRMKVRDIVLEPVRIHGWDRAGLRPRAEQLLETVGLPAAFADRYPHQLSGGQAGRVCVARALAARPKLLIADEPTAGLDLSVQAEVLNLLAELQSEFGLSYLIISHDLAVMRHFTDRLAILHHGRIVEQGPTQQLFAAPVHPYSVGLLQRHRAGARRGGA